IRNGALVVGLGGETVPGNRGSLLLIDPGSGSTTEVATDLPSPIDLSINSDGDVLMAVAGETEDHHRGACGGLFHIDARRLSVLESGKLVWCVSARGPEWLYSEGRPKIGACSPRAPRQPSHPESLHGFTLPPISGN